MAAISITISIFSYRGLHNVEESNGRIVEDVVPNLELVNTMGAAYRTVRSLAKKASTFPSSSDARFQDV